MRRKITAVVLACIIALTLLCSPSLASFKAKVFTSKVTVYKKASKSSAKYGTLKKGTKVTVVQYKSNWAKIRYKGRTGFCDSESLIRVKGVARYAQTTLCIYKKASTSSKVVTTLSAGKKLYVFGQSGSYYLVKCSGKTGYALKSAIGKTKPTPTPTPNLEDPTPTPDTTPTPKPTPAPTVEPNDGKFKTRMPVGLGSTQDTFDESMSNSKKIEYIIYIGQLQLGKPYSSNPKEPDNPTEKGSFDCARFSRYCFKQAKIKIQASAKDQGYDDTYPKISKVADLKRGDLVIFNTNSNDNDLSDHTGIYLGYGYFIHASSGGGAVGVSNLLSGYYSRTFSWGRRILK